MLEQHRAAHVTRSARQLLRRGVVDVLNERIRVIVEQHLDAPPSTFHRAQVEWRHAALILSRGVSARFTQKLDELSMTRLCCEV